MRQIPRYLNEDQRCGYVGIQTNRCPIDLLRTYGLKEGWLLDKRGRMKENRKRQTEINDMEVF